MVQRMLGAHCTRSSRLYLLSKARQRLEYQDPGVGLSEHNYMVLMLRDIWGRLS